MKKFLFVILFIVMSCFMACGTKREIGNYSYVSFDDFKSSSDEYTKRSRIYIQGKLESTEVIDINDAPYIIANVKESKGKEWIVVIGQAGRYSDDVLKKYIGKKVNCFGDYLKK